MNTSLDRRDEAVLDALSLETMEDVIEQLAALHGYSPQPGDKEGTSTLNFATLRPRIDVVEPWQRRLVRWRLVGFALASVAAVGLVMLVVGRWQQRTFDASTRFKGGVPCCGTVTLRVGLDVEKGIAALPSKSIAQGEDLAGHVILAEPGWAALYAVHLPSKSVRELYAALESRAGPGETSASIAFSLDDVGQHVLLLVVTSEAQVLTDDEVIELLVSLGEGRDPTVDGEPCSVDLYDLEVTE